MYKPQEEEEEEDKTKLYRQAFGYQVSSFFTFGTPLKCLMLIMFLSLSCIVFFAVELAFVLLMEVSFFFFLNRANYESLLFLPFPLRGVALDFLFLMTEKVWGKKGEVFASQELKILSF